MAITLVLGDITDLLPVECICQGCRKKWRVTEFKDLRRKILYSGMDAEASDEIFIDCPDCSNFAFPPNKVKEKLMKAHEEWKFMQKNK